MVDYKIIKTEAGEVQSISRIADGASIPVCGGNRDYRKYLTDVENGATTEDVIQPNPVADTTPSLQEQIDTILMLMGV